MKMKKQILMLLLALLVGLPTLSAQSKSLYSLEIRNDSVISYLPYYGRAYSIPYGGGNGLNFKAPLKEYNMKLDKKGNSVITFTARNPEDKFDFRVKVYSNGSTSIDVNMQNRQSISFQGELDVKEE